MQFFVYSEIMITYKRWAPCDGVVFSYKRGGQLYKTKGRKTKIYKLCSNKQMAIVICDASPSSNCSVNSLLFNSIPRVSLHILQFPHSFATNAAFDYLTMAALHVQNIGSGGSRIHASEETGALNLRLRPLGHATLVSALWNLQICLGARYAAYL